MAAEINRLIAMGGTQNKSPVQRYMEARAQVGQERQNKLAMESTRQNMDMQRQEMAMQQQKFQGEQDLAYAEEAWSLFKPVDKLKSPAEQESAYKKRIPELNELRQKYGKPLDDGTTNWNQEGFDALNAKFAPETFETVMEGGIPIQRSMVTGKEIVSPRQRQAKKGSGLWSKIEPSKYTPESIQRFAETERYSDLKAKPKSLRDGLTVGETAIDKAFAKDYVAWTTGGFADVEKNLTQLQDAYARLLSGEENLTGPILGRTPDILKQSTHPEAIDVRDQVEEVVQRNLRLILGAQFTEREGERLIARAYNENLDEAVNAKRVGRLMKAIEVAANAKQDTVDYYNANGTLKGYTGKQYTMSDFNKAIDDPEKETAGWSIKKVP